MVATHIKKIKHSMLCTTGVHLRDNIVFCNFALECESSVCSFCLIYVSKQTKTTISDEMFKGDSTLCLCFNSDCERKKKKNQNDCEKKLFPL